MNSSIYIRLAFTNIKNNRKTYIPYILTAVMTVMMFYIMNALYRSGSVGNGSLKSVLGYAVWVIIIFSVIFLFYTNSFLIKRRKKEIAVYNILGMEKRHIAKMLSVETFVMALISLAAGVAGGILFSKLMYLILLKILRYDVRMKFEVTGKPFLDTLLLFLGIFLATLVFNLMQIKLANPIELLHGSSQGEREPRAKWLLTIFGVIALGVGYYIALTTEEPMDALYMFLVAVVCVILGTYALFTSGSVTVLKMMRKNKKYYYKTNHFTAVSGMIYRMKQNAVGLANICILSTMVLVMISTTISMYIGMEDMLKARFPREFAVQSYEATKEKILAVNNIIEEETEKTAVKMKNELRYRFGNIGASYQEGSLEIDQTRAYSSMSDMYEIYLIPQEDYNQLDKEHVSLGEDEMLLYHTGGTYGKSKIQLGRQTFKIIKELDDMAIENKNKSHIVPVMYLVFRDESVIQEILDEAYKNGGQGNMDKENIKLLKSIRYNVSFDLKGDKKDCSKTVEAVTSRINNETGPATIESREMSRESFFVLYGGLLFIGIYLGSLFLMATVLIIYYKQISEGYDDKERYHIMQKVGMSKKEVKHSIRTQVLTVFFLPLIVAVIHIGVSFKVTTKILAVLNLVNVPLFFTCSVVTVVVFAVFYAIVYAATAKEYYKIVN